MFQKPIRTYGRKNNKSRVQNYKLQICVNLNKQSPSVYTNVWNANCKSIDANDSMDYNLFEDTFDRLAKDVK